MDKPIISICIPTYNRASCLRQCLESIVAQFKDPLVRENAEVVVSDNASTDGTEDVVKEFQKEFSNVFYYKNSENIGVDKNILNVVEKATGEYVWLLGDDDALFSDAIGYMLEKLKLRKFKYCLANCLAHDNGLLKPALKNPNFAIESDQYFKSLKDGIMSMDKTNLVGPFCGLSIQIFNRKIWQNWPNKQEFVGTNTIHMHVLLSAMKEQSFAIIAKPLVKTRSANIRWDVFPGLGSLTKRARGTTKGILWILETYEIPHSKLAIKIEENKTILLGYCTSVLKKYLFKSQTSRDFIKKLMGKL